METDRRVLDRWFQRIELWVVVMWGQRTLPLVMEVGLVGYVRVDDPIHAAFVGSVLHGSLHNQV